jgi:hypothetical protein
MGEASVCIRLRDTGIQRRVLTSTLNAHVLDPHGEQSNNASNIGTAVDGVDAWAAAVSVGDIDADDMDADDEEGDGGDAEDEDGGGGEIEDEDGGGGDAEDEGGGGGAEEEGIKVDAGTDIDDVLESVALVALQRKLLVLSI